MSETEDKKRSSESLRAELQEVLDLIQKQHVVENLVHRTEGPRHDLVEKLVHRQHLTELQRKLDDLHPADVARILELLPLDERLQLWELVRAERDGEILLEVSDAVRESLIAAMDEAELRAAAQTLDTDELADLAPDLPPEVVQDVLLALPLEERAQLQSALTYPEDTVGALMDFDVITVRDDITLEVVMRYLRRLDEFPDQTDKLFVADRRGVIKGVLPLQRLLLHDPETLVKDVMAAEIITFHPEDKAREAANAFERYDLITAPVVAADNKLIARLTVDAVVDFMREEADSEQLERGGLKEEEDLFAPVRKSVKNRWPWLAINLVTAFIASRVIGVFEDSIAKLTALAALMPIIAGIGGNSGNQTITMIVRALALGQISRDSARKLFRKEISVALVNGVVWGAVVGAFALVIYHSLPLAAVMMAAMVLNLLLAATMGVAIPLLRTRFGADPATGSSVMITAITDSGGFFIFLGLATLFLV
ncbi:MAG TPA: magnesium transporter [Pelomicrobium sp.]|nr:magnesium transporter [Pelomicrobium sp.]